MEGLSLDNVISGEEAAELFSPEEEQVESSDDVNDSPEENNYTEDNSTRDEEIDQTAEITDDEESEESESVGSDDEDNTGEESTSSEEVASPNFYSSIAKAFVEDGVFQNLNDDDISSISDADSFRDLIEQELASRLTEKQQRIDYALNYAGMEPSEIQKYENNLNILDGISEEAIEAEGEQAELLRKNIIYEDYIQRGFTQERATKAAERSVAAGTDIEDAKESLQSCKDQIYSRYQEAIGKAEADRDEYEEYVAQQAEELEDAILTQEDAFGELNIDDNTRREVYDVVTAPVYTDPDTGESLTELQQYSKENPIEFIKNVGLLYTLTDGFQSLDNLVKGKVKKEVKKGLRELEHTLNNTARNSDGSLKFSSGVNSDPESFYKNFTLDI